MITWLLHEAVERHNSVPAAASLPHSHRSKVTTSTWRPTSYDSQDSLKVERAAGGSAKRGVVFRASANALLALANS